MDISFSCGHHMVFMKGERRKLPKGRYLRMEMNYGTMPMTSCPSTEPFFTGCCSCPVAAGTICDT